MKTGLGNQTVGFVKIIIIRMYSVACQENLSDFFLPIVIFIVYHSFIEESTYCGFQFGLYFIYEDLLKENNKYKIWCKICLMHCNHLWYSTTWCYTQMFIFTIFVSVLHNLYEWWT